MRLLFRLITRLLVGFCCSIISLIILFQVEEVRTTLTKAIAETIEYKTGWSIKIQNIEGLLPIEMRARQVVINRDGEPVCDIDRIEFMISPFDLLHGSLVFSYFELSGLHTYQPFSASNEPSHLPFPRQIAVKRMEVSDLNIFNQPEALKDLTIRGELSVSTLSSYLTTDLKIYNKQGQNASFILAARPDQWKITIDEGEDGLLHQLLGLNLPAPIDISASITPDTKHCDFQIHSKLYDAFLNGSFVYENSNRIVCDYIEGSYSDHIATLDGEVIFDLNTQLLSGRLELHPLPIPEMSGILESSLLFDGSYAKPTITLTATCPHLEIRNVPVDQFHLKTLCTIGDTGIDSQWTVAGQVNTIPIQLNFQSNIAQTIEMTDFVAQVPSGSISGNGTYDGDLACHLEGDLHDLNQLTTPFNWPVKGAASFKCDLSPERTVWTVLGSEIEWSDWTFEKITLQKEINGSRLCDYTMSAHQVKWKETTWDKLSLGTSITPDRQTWPFTMMATGQKQDQVEINASGQWHWDQDEAFVHMGSLSGTLFAHPFELIKPINCFVTDKTFRTSHVEFHLEDGSVAFEGKIDEDEINCLLDIKHLPIDLTNHLLPQSLGINGDASLFLRLMGPPSDIQGSMVLQGESLQVYDESLAKLPLSHGKIEAVLAHNQLTFEGRLTNADNPFYAKGVVPFTVSLNPIQWELPSQEPIQAHLTTSGEISPYLKLFVTDTTNVEGKIDIDVDVGGTVERPIVEGRAHLTNGLFESLNTGLVINDIECLLIGNDKKLILDHLTGNDGGDGELTANGFFELDKEENYPFELSVDLNDAVVVRLDYADMATSGTVTLTGNQTRGKISGDVTVDQVNLQIPEQIPVQMKTVDVTFINDPDGKSATHPKKSKEPWPIDLDLHFNVPSNFFVTGRDLESEWHGEFSFTGTTLDPKVYGTLQLMRGEYSFNGKSFISTQGSVNFAGDPGSKTTIYVVGEQQIDNIKVQAILKGDLSAPALSFRSNPNMSEKEILAWILFGHGIDEITPFQKAQLSESVFTLSSGENPDMISQLRRDMGIDRLDISSHETEERNELSLRIGKYISRGIYVSLSKSINAEANQVAIEANLTRHLKVQAEVGDNAEGKMSLKWARDY